MDEGPHVYLLLRFQVDVAAQLRVEKHRANRTLLAVGHELEKERNAHGWFVPVRRFTRGPFPVRLQSGDGEVSRRGIVAQRAWGKKVKRLKKLKKLKKVKNKVRIFLAD